MLSHDNITWTSRIAKERHAYVHDVFMSYLPLSHIAGENSQQRSKLQLIQYSTLLLFIIAHMLDCYMNLAGGGKTAFPDKNVLQGTMVANDESVLCSQYFSLELL